MWAVRWHWRRPQATSWRFDETYVKVRGQWTYLHRAVDKFGNVMDPTCKAKAAKCFLGKALNGLKDWEKPAVINIDKAPPYGIAVAQLMAESKCPAELVHRQVKYLNNVVEADHGKLKQLIKPARGFKTLKSLCDDQRFRGHARFAQRTGCNFQLSGRHPWRSPHC